MSLFKCRRCEKLELLLKLKEKDYDDLVRQLQVYKNNRYASEKIIIVHQKMLRLMKELECFMDEDGLVNYDDALKDSFYGFTDLNGDNPVNSTPEMSMELIVSRNTVGNLSNTISVLRDENKSFCDSISALKKLSSDRQDTILSQEHEILMLKLLLDKNNIPHD
jgi:hypothetical protein